MRLDTATTAGTGSASGWSVMPNPLGGWQWSAYGPRGGSLGTAPTESAARRVAERAQHDLCKPRATEDL